MTIKTTILTDQTRTSTLFITIQIIRAYEWDEEEVSSNDNEMVEVKVQMAQAEDNDAISKEGAKMKVYKAGKGLLYVKRNKAISLGNVTSRVGIEVHQLSLKDCTYKALMNELVNDDINLSKLKINTGFINGLPKKWLKDSELASLFGKLKYKENLIDSIYETKKNKSLVSATPLSTAFFSTSIVQDFQDSPDDEEDTRSSHEYLNDLEEEYQARALLVKSKRFFKKVPSYQSPFQSKSLSSSHHKPELRPTKDIEAKYNKVKAKMALLSSSASASKASTVKNKGFIAEAYEWDEEEVSSNDNEMVEVKVLMALPEDNDVVSKEGARNGEWLKISMRKCISKQIPSQKKRILGVDQLTKDPSSLGQKDLVFVKSSADDTNVTIPSVERPWLSEAEGFILPNHDTGRILPAESQRNTTDPLVAVTDSSVTDYDSADESLVCSTPLPPLKKLDGVEPISGPKTIKSILRSKSTFKAEALKGVIINEPSSAPAKGNKSSSASKVHSAPAGKLKSVKIEDDPPLAIVMKELNNLKLQFSKNQSSYSRSVRNDHRTCDHAEYISTMNISQHLKSLGRASSRSKIIRPLKRFFPPCTHCGRIDHLSNECLYYPICGLCRSYDHDINCHNRIISLEREINPRNPQHTFKRCEVCGSLTHTTTEWFKRGEALQAKKAEALESTRVESSNANRSKTPTRRSINHEKYTLVIIDEYSRYTWVYFLKKKSQAPKTIMSFIKRVENQNDIKVKQLRTDNVYIHNHKDHLGNFDEKADDGYLLGYSLVSKAFRLFNTRRQQTKETYHIRFDESPDAIKFLKPSVDNINIAETERYPPDEYLHPYEPS
ncbi:retrovirus-related pol polyprotein from transposon TNT 1-94 [Tanacetum coccineum]